MTSINIINRIINIIAIVNAEARSVMKGKQTIGNLYFILGDYLTEDTSVRLQLSV